MVDISQFVVNNTEYNVADDTKVPYDLLQDTVGFTSKNLFDVSLQSTTHDGVIWTVVDGVITANGTTTANLNIVLGEIYLLPGTYILTGNTITDLSVRLRLYEKSNASNVIAWGDGIPTKFTVTSAKLYVMSIRYNNNISLTNQLFNPMIRKADIMDDTYEPYNPSIKQILRNNKIIEGKNLLPYPYVETSKTASGITFTDNGDGSISMSGTSGSNGAGISLNSALDLPSGKYIVSWEWSGTVSANKVSLKIGHKDNTWWTECNTAGQNSVELTIDDSITNNSVITVAINLSANITVTNLTVKPMIRKATETDPTYEQYYIPGVVSQEAQSILGAKNLVIFPYSRRSYTSAGVTYTVSSDGAIVANGTATGDSYFNLHYSRNNKIIPKMFLKKGKYILTGCPANGGSSNYQLRCFYYDSINNLDLNLKNDSGEGSTIEVTDNISQFPIFLQIMVKSGQVCSNLTFKPMIILADCKDTVYEIPVKTNEVLTKELITQRIDATVVDVSKIATIHELRITQYGGIIQLFADFTTGENAISSWTPIIQFSNNLIRSSGNLGLLVRDVTTQSNSTISVFSINGDNQITTAFNYLANNRYQLSAVFIIGISDYAL